MIFLILGTRSEVIKFSSLIRELTQRKIPFKTIHTGQHNTLDLMKSLELPEPNYYLGKSLRYKWSKSRIAPFFALFWSASAFLKLRKIFKKEKPRIIVLNGNTLAVPISCFASKSILKSKTKISHLESGIRGKTTKAFFCDLLYIIGDYFSDILITFDRAAYEMLKSHYTNKKVVFSGDIKKDIISNILINNQFERKEEFITINIVRSLSNKEDIRKFYEILFHIKGNIALILNPKIKQLFIKYDYSSKIRKLENIKILDSLNYLEFLKVMLKSKLIITDSGGVQSECVLLKIPCIVLNDFASYPELEKKGLIKVTSLNKNKILNIIDDINNKGVYYQLIKNSDYGKDMYPTNTIIKTLQEGLQ